MNKQLLNSNTEREAQINSSFSSLSEQFPSAKTEITIESNEDKENREILQLGDYDNIHASFSKCTIGNRSILGSLYRT